MTKQPVKDSYAGTGRSFIRGWVICRKPTDYPECYVARLWLDDHPASTVIASTDLDLLRKILIEYFHAVLRFDPQPGDPDVVHEVRF
jgi:hypothetical protein